MKILTPDKSLKIARRAHLVQQLILYPVVMVLISIPCTICRVIDAVYGDDQAGTAIVLSIFMPALGLAYFVCFLLTADIEMDCKIRLNKCCPGSFSEAQYQPVSRPYTYSTVNSSSFERV